MINMAIIDADTIVYAAAGACQYKDKETEEVIVRDPVEFAYGNAKRKMLQILETTKVKDYCCYLTASNDLTAFRNKIYSDYKANRKDAVRPVYYYKVREYLIKHWNAEVVSGIEADDKVCEMMYQFHEYGFQENQAKAIGMEPGLGWECCNLPAVLCGIDKDLNQIPGLHYNYNKDEFYYITPIEGLRALYIQMLTGDDADNIPRIRFRWGTKKEDKLVKKALQEAKSEVELYKIVFNEIDRLNMIDNHKQIVEIEDQIQLLGDLLYLRKSKDDHYRSPLNVK